MKTFNSILIFVLFFASAASQMKAMEPSYYQKLKRMSDVITQRRDNGQPTQKTLKLKQMLDQKEQQENKWLKNLELSLNNPLTQEQSKQIVEDFKTVNDPLVQANFFVLLCRSLGKINVPLDMKSSLYKLAYNVAANFQEKFKKTKNPYVQQNFLAFLWTLLGKINVPSDMKSSLYKLAYNVAGDFQEKFKETEHPYVQYQFLALLWTLQYKRVVLWPKKTTCPTFFTM